MDVSPHVRDGGLLLSPPFCTQSWFCFHSSGMIRLNCIADLYLHMSKAGLKCRQLSSFRHDRHCKTAVAKQPRCGCPKQTRVFSSSRLAKLTSTCCPRHARRLAPHLVRTICRLYSNSGSIAAARSLGKQFGSWAQRQSWGHGKWREAQDAPSSI